ncbi:MAG TPA: DinB family protein [Anaerolineales bacterium]|nr:DinB family protein [Anaerolineales bacterium]
MFNFELTNAIENFAALMLPLSEKDLERTWVWKDHDEEGVRFAFFVTIQELRQLAVTLAARHKPPTQAQHILGQYHKQYMDLQAAIFGLSKEDSEHAPAEGEWTVRQVYAHILGADFGFRAVIRYALEGHRAEKWMPEPTPESEYPCLYGMGESEYRDLTKGPLETMLVFHREMHPQVIDEFINITDEELDLPAAFWEETRFPIRHRLHRFEAHFVQHTAQIDKTLAAIDHAPSESKRLIRYLFAALAEVNANLIGENNSQEGCAKLAKSINSRIMEIKSILEK